MQYCSGNRLFFLIPQADSIIAGKMKGATRGRGWRPHTRKTEVLPHFLCFSRVFLMSGAAGDFTLNKWLHTIPSFLPSLQDSEGQPHRTTVGRQAQVTGDLDISQRLQKFRHRNLKASENIKLHIKVLIFPYLRQPLSPQLCCLFHAPFPARKITVYSVQSNYGMIKTISISFKCFIGQIDGCFY